MDEDLIVGLLFIILFLTFPFLLVLSILSCIAYSRTRTWQKEQARLHQPGAEPLVEDPEEEEDDFLDTEDEEDYKSRKAEEAADRNLTTRQKFRKEFGKAWRGNGVKDVAKQREREERRKIAKAVAREIERLERRRGRQQRENGGEGSSVRGEELLPRYEAAVAGDRK